MKYGSKSLLMIMLVLGACAPGVHGRLEGGPQRDLVEVSAGGGGAEAERSKYGGSEDDRFRNGRLQNDRSRNDRLPRGVIRVGANERSTLPVGVLRMESRPGVGLGSAALLGMPAGSSRGAALAAGRSGVLPSNVDPAPLAELVLREANVLRRRHGAGALRTDATLTRAAVRYAQELADRREIEHVSATPGRRTFRERIEAEGARVRIGGENLARLTSSAEVLGERVVDAWLRSPGHRYNLLDPIFARTGVGVWLGGDGVWYVVQVYGTGN